MHRRHKQVPHGRTGPDVIIFAVIGWCLLSLESAAELHGRAGLVLVSEYLS